MPNEYSGAEEVNDRNEKYKRKHQYQSRPKRRISELEDGNFEITQFEEKKE